MTLVIAAAAALIAAIIQRITGLGFVLVIIGPLVIAFGALGGVTVAVLLALVASLAAVPLVWRDIDWRRSLWLMWPGLLTAPLGVLVVRVLPEPALLLLVGALAILALSASHIPGLSSAFSGRSGAVAAGAAGGFMHVTSGLSGPALAAHAVGDGWPQRSFAASVQAIFVVFSALSVALRGLPTIPVVDVVILIAATAVGIVAGTLLSRFVPTRLARLAMLTIAWAGSIVVLIRAVVAFASS